MFDIEFTLTDGSTVKHSGDTSEVLEQMEEILRLYPSVHDLEKTKLIFGSNEVIGYEEIYQFIDSLRGSNELFKYKLYRQSNNQLLQSWMGNSEYLKISLAELYESDIDCSIVLETLDSKVSTTKELPSDVDWYDEIDNLTAELSQKRNLT